ncbi:hypothetical protein P389DRAFT_168907 [Cystobasidium minutum MCA 4210]|uniref:uncharacterized protein n=1 Tax=Cystobasidium minutum MCA 4210 TaxID=1397322 RepID=UPI0034CF72A2|eukprot:jgi/Rhomi1/168907/fgenesh1_kg.3_\
MDEDTTIVPPVSTPTRRKKRSNASLIRRIYSLLVSRLSAPLLTSLLLLPILPSSNKHSNAIFELVPFYKSLKCLLASHTSYARVHETKYRQDTQQWLSYWTIYSFVRFLEGTRCNVSTSQERKRVLVNLIALLPRLIRERVSKLFPTSTSSSLSIPASSTTRSRAMTLATQIAGSSTRWTLLKSILLFYAMDDELQGARRIIKEVVKPVFGFFVNSIEEEDEEDNDIIQEEAPARRSALSRDDNVQGSGSILKLSLASSEEQQERENEDNELLHTPSTPELSMDGSYGGRSSSDCINDMEYENKMSNEDDGVMTVIIQKSSSNTAVTSTTWPLETIAVEGNHWVH